MWLTSFGEIIYYYISLYIIISIHGVNELIHAIAKAPFPSTEAPETQTFVHLHGPDRAGPEPGGFYELSASKASSAALQPSSRLPRAAPFRSTYFANFVTPPFPIFRCRPWRVRELRAALRAACALHCALCVPDPAPASLPRVLNRQRTPVRPDLPGAAAVKVHVHCAHDARTCNNMLP